MTLAFTITDVQVNDPDVLRLWDSVNSRYYYIMYYTYYPSGLGDPTNYIAVSTSLDGINWSSHGVLIGADNGIDSDGAWSPSAYSVDSTGSTVYIYFHNNHPDGRIFRTTLSNSGLTFNDTTTIAVTDAGTFRAT
jgi:sucrose-6-phosphate hydrolase SacC (GH32 family)